MCRLSSETSVDEKVEFFKEWVKAHKDDAENILRMPMLVTEFGLSEEKPGFSQAMQAAFYGVVYDQMYETAVAKQGAASGALQWQLLPQEMRSWNDGYGIDPASGSFITRMIKYQSQRLNALYQPCSRSTNRTAPHRDYQFQNDLQVIIG